MDDEPFLTFLDREVKRHERAISDQARALSRDLIRLADRIDRGGARVNELGEVQGRGAMIDARCGAWGAAREALRSAHAFADDARVGH